MHCPSDSGPRPAGPLLIPRAALQAFHGVRARWITEPSAAGWSEPVLMEWSLAGEYWVDQHAHTEYAFVLEGCLHVDVNDQCVVAEAGDTVCVPAGSIGRYYAPVYARMLGVYGPNPDGLPPRMLGSGRLP